VGTPPAAAARPLLLDAGLAHRVRLVVGLAGLSPRVSDHEDRDDRVPHEHGAKTHQLRSVRAITAATTTAVATNRTTISRGIMRQGRGLHPEPTRPLRPSLD
jgi:hypothetical protein